jgi:hypothetical protein
LKFSLFVLSQVLVASSYIIDLILVTTTTSTSGEVDVDVDVEREREREREVLFCREVRERRRRNHSSKQHIILNVVI